MNNPVKTENAINSNNDGSEITPSDFSFTDPVIPITDKAKAIVLVMAIPVLFAVSIPLFPIMLLNTWVRARAANDQLTSAPPVAPAKTTGASGASGSTDG